MAALPRRNVPSPLTYHPQYGFSNPVNPKIACLGNPINEAPFSCCYTVSVFRKVILSGKRHAMQDRKLVRIQEKGQVTIPTEIRKKLGLKRGDLVAVMETPEGVFITPQQVLATKALDSIGEILKEKGLTLAEVISAGRDIRTDLLQETYGITEPPKARLS
jgi:antitoxin PrlF